MKLKTIKNVAYTDEQAIGAIPNGTIIKKTMYEPGDFKAVGALGIVTGSLPNPPENQVEGKPFVKYLYFIKWNGFDKPIAILDYKIKTLD